MSFLAPSALAFLAICIPIVGLHMLRMRRRPVRVSTTMFWEKAVDDLQANAPWRPLRRSLLLPLQLIAALALVLAIMRPTVSYSRVFSGNLIIVVDQSYGMRATDVAPSRFVVAQRKARQLIANLPAGKTATIIGMTDHPVFAASGESNRSILDKAVDGLRAGPSMPNFSQALSLASSVGQAHASTEVVVLTSPAGGIGRLPFPVPFPVRIERISGDIANLSVVSFTGARKGSHDGARAVIANTGHAALSTDIDLRAGNRLIDVRPLTLLPGKTKTLTWSGLPVAGVLRLSSTLHDAVAADNQRWAVIPAAQSRSVLFAGKRDFFLKEALAAAPGVRLSVVAPAKYSPAQGARYDLVVFDGYHPARMPRAATLIVDPAEGRYGPVTFGRYQTAGAMRSVSEQGMLPSWLTGFADVSDVNVAAARQTTLPAWMAPLAEASAGSRATVLLAAGQKPGCACAPEAVIPFNLQRSNWPLRLSFPILVQHLIRYLARPDGVPSTVVAQGAPVSFTVSPATTAVRVTTPSLRTYHLASPDGVFTQTGSEGVYHARFTESGGRTSSSLFVVNSQHTWKASVAKATTIVLRGAPQRKTATTSLAVDIAPVLAALALLVLSAEWLAGARR